MSTPPVNVFSAGLGFALPIAFMALFVLGPSGEGDRLVAILRGICAQRPSHTIGFPGDVMALEARMFGIFAGFAVTVVYAWATGGWRRTRLPRGWQLGVLIGFVVIMGIDGVRSLYYDIGARGAFWTPRTDLRLITGLLCGFAMAAFIAPAVSQALFKDTEDVPLFRSWRELGFGLAVIAAVAAISLLPFMPRRVLSMFAVVSVLVGFWIVNTHFIVVAWEGRAEATGWLQLQKYALAGFSMLRTFMERAFGVQWLI
jgi:uncharacterized membrane protein